MTRFLPWFGGLVMSAHFGAPLDCRSSNLPEEPPAPSTTPDPPAEVKQEVVQPHLLVEGERLYIAGLQTFAAQVLQRGMLFSVYDSRDERDRAVVQVFQRAVSNGSRVQVHLVCRALVRDSSDLENLSGLPVRVIPARGGVQVGQCLTQVIDINEDSVTLDVGKATGLKPNDEYMLLGEPLCAQGFVPLGLDTKGNGTCVLSETPGDLTGMVSTCKIVEDPKGGVAVNGYALFRARIEP